MELELEALELLEVEDRPRGDDLCKQFTSCVTTGTG